MADARVKIEISADEAKAIMAFRRVAAGSQSLKRGLRKVTDETKRSKKSGRDFLSIFHMGNIAQATAGLASLYQAVKLVRDEIDHIFNRQQEAARVQTDIGAQWLGAIAAMPERIRAMGQEWRRSLVTEVQGQAGVSQAEILKGMQAVGSGIAAGTPEQYREINILAGRMSELTADQDMPLFGGAAALLMNVAGIEDPAAAMGMMLKLGTGTPIQELSTQAKNIPRAMGKLAPLEPSFEEAAEFYSVFTQSVADITGRLGGTQAAGVAKKLRTTGLFPTGFGDELAPFTQEQMAGKGSLELLGILREDMQKRGADFAEITAVAQDLSESAAGFGFLSTFFMADAADPKRKRMDERIAVALETFTPTVTTADEAALARNLETKISETLAEPAVTGLVAKRRGEAAREMVQTSARGEALGIQGIIVEQLEKFQKSLPESSALATRLNKVVLGLGDTTMAPERALRMLRGMGEPTVAGGYGMAEAAPGGGPMLMREMPADERRGLDAMISIMEMLLEAQKEQTEVTKEMVAAVKKQGIMLPGMHGGMMPLLGTADVEA